MSVQALGVLEHPISQQTLSDALCSGPCLVQCLREPKAIFSTAINSYGRSPRKQGFQHREEQGGHLKALFVQHTHQSSNVQHRVVSS